MWKWYDDTNWVDYGKAQNDILDKAGNNFRIDVDDERYVETSDLKEIYRLFGELPKDITGLCALQHRKDNPQRVRLVKNAAIDTLIHDTIFFYGEREYSKSRCRLEADNELQ
ncbi:hypothetical protein EDI_127350 [Entamoeba dispar SAW760]|uniref:WWE domain-containing protein n=1 Tax=Entamoeba dispar (strain ATCC PRA-260 / SAW760) TaxID=370354 RepID=B0E8I8_ENTDS|nr:uncharacterized protein EDI_127350 [Entamoeba dispar SAW760]EDR29169.1 hypothetical protein EDI_127350 [Entamoeba dispar SAW760]|eukprot:EDR29169.1 hypothetical protein EDI_127350 [Entamoeba dispar SAW760]